MNLFRNMFTGYLVWPKKVMVVALMTVVCFPMSSCRSVSGLEGEYRYKIGVCDWMILKRQKPGAIKLAYEIGADGVEVDMGGLGNRPTFDNNLAVPSFRHQYDSLLDHYQIEISSVAMSGFYAQSFATRDGIERMISDCIQTMKWMNVKVAFLPLGVEGDLVKFPERRPAIVDRLKFAGKIAEKENIIIGIETALDASGEVELLKEIGSPAIQIYFNFANALEAGRDLCKELKILGKERICQIHCTDKDGVWLQDNSRIDLKKVRKTLDKMGWRGWLVLERSRDARFPTEVKKNFGANTAYLKTIFQHGKK
jgi:L-ribulose-5-phosphate 3-epimerase